MLTGSFAATRETTMPSYYCCASPVAPEYTLKPRRHHECSQHYGSIDIRVAQPRYHWHVDSYAQDNVPQSLGPRTAMHDATP